MAHNVVETLKEPDFISIWEGEVNKILSNGVIWIDKSILWNNFCDQNNISSDEEHLISCLEFEEIDRITNEELHLEVLKTFGRVTNQII